MKDTGYIRKEECEQIIPVDQNKVFYWIFPKNSRWGKINEREQYTRVDQIMVLISHQRRLMDTTDTESKIIYIFETK